MLSSLQAVGEATTAFSATNVDDLFLLMLFFSREDQRLRPWQVVVGQYLGIAALVAVSLLSLLGRLALPQEWIGILGLFPISLGLTQLAETFNGSGDGPADDGPAAGSSQAWWAAIFAVASLTIANGSDNISVYMALMANSDNLHLRVFLAVFTCLTGLWCLLAWWLSQTTVLARPLHRFRRDLAPLLLVGIGALVLWEGQTLRQPPLALVTLACLSVMVLSLWRQLRRLRMRPPIEALQP